MNISSKIATDFATRIKPVFKNNAKNKAIEDKLLENGYFYDRWVVNLAQTFANLPTDRRDLKSKKKLRERDFATKSMHFMARAEMNNTINAYQSLTNNGYSQDEAVEILEDMTRKTQNPSTALEETGIYSSIKRNPYLGLMFPFYGQPSVARNILLKAIISKDPEKIATASASLVSSSAFSAILQYSLGLISSGALTKMIIGTDDGDDEKNADNIAEYAIKRLLNELTDIALPGASKITEILMDTLKDTKKKGKWELKGKEKDTTLKIAGLSAIDSAAESNILSGTAKKGLFSAVNLYKGYRTNNKKMMFKNALGLIDTLAVTAGKPIGGITQAGKLVIGATGTSLDSKSGRQKTSASKARKWKMN